jgi:N,N'-diacetyllegionaminate synthase
MKFHSSIEVGNRIISSSSPTFVIAEAGVNHGGDMSIAIELIDVAVDAGADAVKFQTFRAEELILKNIKKAPYQLKTTDECESQFEMLKKLEVSKSQNLALKEYCDNKEIVFLTTPFDELSLHELDEISLAAYKVASTDTTNLPFLEKVAKRGKPIFLSTGMSYLSEIELALETIYKHNKNVILLHCTANYPIEDNEVNLNVINTFRKNFDILVGYSDHSVGVGAAPYAIPMGAKVVEKHFTLDKTLEGPDHSASLSPDGLILFVKTVRTVDKYMGSSIKKPTLSEINTRSSLQKCMVANGDIKEGDSFTKDNIIAKRTGGMGISPLYFNELIGHISTKDYKHNEVIGI